MADIWFRNGQVHTMDPLHPWAESVVVRDGTILFVGADGESRAQVGAGADEVDLEGGFLMPGFIDGHNHLIGGALSKVGVSLEGFHGKDAVLEQIGRYAEAHPARDVIRGHGWTPFTFGGALPHRTWLDSVTDTRPAFLHSYDVHDVWANSAALHAAGIHAGTPDPNPPTSYYPRDPDGSPSGTCCEPEAWVRLAITLGMFSVQSIAEAMQLTMSSAPGWGITSYFDAGTLLTSQRVVRDTWAHLMSLDEAGELPVRIVGSHVVRSPDVDPCDAVETLRELHLEVRSPNISITTLKLFMDGVTLTHTGSMIEPYADQPHHGGWVLPPEYVLRAAEAGNLAGFDVHIHADGDQGVRSALDAFEHVRSARPQLTPRNTVCHLGFCNPDDVARFAPLGVTANGTPMWGTDYRGEFVDSYPIIAGPERFRRDFCPYGSIVRSGANVTFGADCPGVEVHEIAPLMQIEAAVTRRRPGRPDDRPAGAHEQVSVADALRAYTVNGARALRLEATTGSIEVGKRADLVHLGRSPYEVAHHEIHAIPVVRTMLGGRFTFG